MSLTRGEKETIIRFDEEDEMATVYTCSQPVMRRMAVLGEKSKEIVMVSQDKYSKTYKPPQGNDRFQNTA